MRKKRQKDQVVVEWLLLIIKEHTTHNIILCIFCSSPFPKGSSQFTSYVSQRTLSETLSRCYMQSFASSSICISTVLFSYQLKDFFLFASTIDLEIPQTFNRHFN